MNDFMPRSLSLTMRLYVALILASALVFTVFFASAWWTESRSLETMLQENGRSLSAGVEQSINLGMQLGEVDLVRDGASSVENIPNVLTVDIYNPDGSRLVLLGAKHALVALPQLSKAKHDGLTYETLDKGRLERVIALVHANHGEFVGYSVLDLSRAGVNKSINSVLIMSALISLLLLLLFWWLTGQAIRVFKRPLDELDHAVESVTQGKLDVSIEPLAKV